MSTPVLAVNIRLRLKLSLAHNKHTDAVVIPVAKVYTLTRLTIIETISANSGSSHF